MKNSSILRSFGIPIIAALLAGAAFGQGLTGSINGTVTDPSGSAIPGTEITLTNVATSQTRQSKPDASGDFVFTQILPGAFRVVISGKGFKRYEETSIVVTSAERVVLKRIELQVGDITQTVEVIAEAARLQTQSAERSGLISLEQTQNVPLKGRDYLGLLKLLPGIIDTQNRNAPGWNNLSSVSVNGGRTGTLNLTLDGVSSLDDRTLPRPVGRCSGRNQSAALQLSSRIWALVGRHD